MFVYMRIIDVGFKKDEYYGLVVLFVVAKLKVCRPA